MNATSQHRELGMAWLVVTRNCWTKQKSIGWNRVEPGLHPNKAVTLVGELTPTLRIDAVNVYF
jgi:hypothetical protein